MSELVALLDPPASDSMGMVPLVTREPDGRMTVQGLARSPRRPISSSELNALIASRQAMPTDPLPVDFSRASNPVAMWVGEAFSESAHALGVAPPPAPVDLVAVRRLGHAAVGASDEIYARLEIWLQRAFRKVIEDRNHSLATLMAQALPNHILTQTALWYSAPSAEYRERELKWFQRLREDAGKSEEARTLEGQFKELSERPPWASLKAVFLMSGLAGTGHREAARTLARTVGATIEGMSLVGFGDFLRKEFQYLHHKKASKSELQEFGQRWVLERPYRFAQSVLTQSDLAFDPVVLVVDGVRHPVIREAIKFIVDKPLNHYAIELPPELVAQNLEREVGKALIPKVQLAATEIALKDFMHQIPGRIKYDESASPNQRQFDEASQWIYEKVGERG